MPDNSKRCSVPFTRPCPAPRRSGRRCRIRGKPGMITAARSSGLHFSGSGVAPESRVPASTRRGQGQRGKSALHGKSARLRHVLFPPDAEFPRSSASARSSAEPVGDREGGRPPHGSRMLRHPRRAQVPAARERGSGADLRDHTGAMKNAVHDDRLARRLPPVSFGAAAGALALAADRAPQGGAVRGAGGRLGAPFLDPD